MDRRRAQTNNQIRTLTAFLPVVMNETDAGLVIASGIPTQ